MRERSAGGGSYILGSRAESLPVGDVWVAGLNALDLIPIHTTRQPNTSHMSTCIS
jgi:hypothetical protein